MADLEDDSWADAPAAKRPKQEEAAFETIEAPADQAPGELVNDSWADKPKQPATTRPSLDDAWADLPEVRRPATKAWQRQPRVPPPDAGPLEDDSWADVQRKPRRPNREERLRDLLNREQPARPALPAPVRRLPPLPPSARTPATVPAEKPPVELEPLDETAKFLREVLGLMMSYEPPKGKRPSVLNRHLPEPDWVPAAEILAEEKLARLRDCVDTSDSIETMQSDEGLLLRMTRHPTAADDIEHMEKCAVRLSSECGISEEEARRRLSDDAKFMEFWSALRIIGAASPEEAHLARTLSVRVKILTDAHRISSYVFPEATWAVARDGLEKVKKYRQVLSAWLAASNDKTEEDLQRCLEEIVAAWPDVRSVDKEEGAKGGKGKGGGKAKGKEKGKDKGKGKKGGWKGKDERGREEASAP